MLRVHALQLLLLGTLVWLLACEEGEPRAPAMPRSAPDASRGTPDTPEPASPRDAAVPTLPRGVLTASRAEVCPGECVTLRAPSGEGVRYQWSHDATATAPELRVCPEADTRYEVRVVTDLQGEFASGDEQYDVTVRVGDACEPRSSEVVEQCRARMFIVGETRPQYWLGGGNPWDGAHLLAMLEDGGMRVVGQFSGELDIAGQRYESDTPRGFVVDLDAHCEVVRVTMLGGPSNELLAYGLAVDPAGNSLIIAQVKGTLETATGTVGSDSYSNVVLKLDPQGAALWARAYTIGQSFSDVRVDAAGNVYIAGYGNNQAYHGERLLPLQNSGYGMAKLDARGELLWARELTLWELYGSGNNAHIDALPDGRVAIASCLSELADATLGPSCRVELLDPQGGRLWRSTLRFDGETGVGDSVLAFGRDGRIALHVLTAPVEGARQSVSLNLMLDASGQELWRERSVLAHLDEPTELHAVAVDRWNNVLSAASFAISHGVNGTPLQSTDQSHSLRKLDAHGAPRWTARTGDAGDAALLGIATNRAGEVGLATTFATEPLFPSALVIVKYAP